MLTLAITGFDSDPANVTDILGFEPTSVGHKGIETLPSKRPKRSNGWWRDVYPDRLTDGAAHDASLSALVDLLKGREARFARLRQEVRPEAVGIYGGFYVPPNQQSGIWLDPQQMRVLAECEVEWGLDLFTSS
jgi:hypothetical protein